MPSRRRRKEPANLATTDPVARFGALLKESSEREAAARERAAAAKRDAAAAAKAAADHRAALASARRELERAIAAAREAKASRRGIAEADDAWRRAKAALIELETGAPPPWSPSEEA